MSLQDTFDRALVTLNEAALDDALWPAAAGIMDEACGTTGDSLAVGYGFGDDVEIHFARICRHGERRRDFERSYFTQTHWRDERLTRLRLLPDSKVVHVSELFSEQELKTSVVYNERLPLSGGQNGLNVRLDGPDGARIVWTVADPVDAAGWTSTRLEMVRSLLPHIRQFVRTRLALSSAGALGASLSELLSGKGIGVIHLGRQGRILNANDRALEILRRGDGLFEDEGSLHARWPADDARLQRLLLELLPRSATPAKGGSITVRRVSRRSRLNVHAAPLSLWPPAFGTWSASALLLIVEGHQPLPAVKPLA